MNNHRRRSPAFKTGLALLAYSALSLNLLSAAQKPNILFIVADDLGWKDVGFHGSDIRTEVTNLNQDLTNFTLVFRHVRRPRAS